MFKMYDLNLKEIPFPDGVMPLDIFVGSISKSRETETIPGRNGVMNYGFNYDSRPVRITLLAEGNDRIDYRLIRNAVFEIFDLHDVFYIEETDVPSRVLKVTIDESYQPDRLTRDDASFDINLRTLDSVFWESKYTTLELHDSGYDATAEKYGLVDNIDDEKVKYRFEPEVSTLNLTAAMFEQGSLLLSNGLPGTGNEHMARSKVYSSIIPGQRYEVSYTDTTGAVNNIRLFQYDNNNNLLDADSGRIVGQGSANFTAVGSKIKLLIYANSGMNVLASEIGNGVKISLTGYSSTNSFNLFNAGNVTIEPEDMMLNIELKGATSSGNLSLKNITTGEEFKLNKAISNRNVKLKGINVTENGINVFRDTNRRFISFVPGDNRFEVTGATFDELSFEFNYLYK